MNHWTLTMHIALSISAAGCSFDSTGSLIPDSAPAPALDSMPASDAMPAPDAMSAPDAMPPPATIQLLGTGTAALLGGDLTDPEDDGDETVDITIQNWPGLGNWNFVGLTASVDAYFSDPNVNQNPREGAFDAFDNRVGGGTDKWCCSGPTQNVTVEFLEAVSLTHLTITSGNDVPTRDPLEFEIQGSNDGVAFNTIFRRDDDMSIWNSRNQVAQITLPGPSAPYRFLRYEVLRTGGNHQIGEIEYFGSVAAQPGTQPKTQ